MGGWGSGEEVWHPPSIDLSLFQLSQENKILNIREIIAFIYVDRNDGRREGRREEEREKKEKKKEKEREVEVEQGRERKGGERRKGNLNPRRVFSIDKSKAIHST